MRHWFKDQHFRSLLKNSSYLAASRVVAAVAGIATISFAAHALGVLLFGALILITSYAKAVSGLSKFQSWQLIVRYGGGIVCIAAAICILLLQRMRNIWIEQGR